MRKLFLTCGLFLIGFVSFAQETKENGTIYIKHPYIDAANKTIVAYLAKDIAGNKKLYADTAKVWISGMDKQIGIDEALKMWASDFDSFDSIKLVTVGYPDYLHYVDQDQKYVQSWWRWSGKSKKSGVKVTVDFVQFDKFNKDGKIENETLYGDFSKMEKER